MKYRITNTRSGVDLGTYEGETEEDALDAMAQDAGYRDYADLLANVPNASREELEVQP